MFISLHYPFAVFLFMFSETSEQTHSLRFSSPLSMIKDTIKALVSISQAHSLTVAYRSYAVHYFNHINAHDHSFWFSVCYSFSESFSEK